MSKTPDRRVDGDRAVSTEPQYELGLPLGAEVEAPVEHVEVVLPIEWGEAETDATHAGERTATVLASVMRIPPTNGDDGQTGAEPPKKP